MAPLSADLRRGEAVGFGGKISLSLSPRPAKETDLLSTRGHYVGVPPCRTQLA